MSWAHYGDLVAYARRVLGDRRDAAEDIVQEAYLRLLGLAASDEAPTSARPWLFRVVRNLAIDERRSALRRADPVADTAILGTAALDDTYALVEHREELSDALRDIAALPPRERRALEMDQAGYGAAAIAEELKTTPNAVHQALFRARRRLRDARAIAWGLIPVGLIPLALRAADPALAVTVTNLPPGLPVGRALPVAGIVAVAMVGGSAVAPNLDGDHSLQPSIEAIAKAAAQRATEDAAVDDNPEERPAHGNRGPSENSGPGSRSSGKGSAGDDDGDDLDTSGPGRNRGTGGGDDDGDGQGRNRGSGGATPGTDDGPDDGGISGKRGSGSGSVSGGSGSGGGGSGSSTSDAVDAPDEPDAPDAPDAPDLPDESP